MNECYCENLRIWNAIFYPEKIDEKCEECIKK